MPIDTVEIRFPFPMDSPMVKAKAIQFESITTIWSFIMNTAFSLPSIYDNFPLIFLASSILKLTGLEVLEDNNFWSLLSDFFWVRGSED